MKQIGFASFLLHPILRNMAHAASAPFENAPRFIMLFKGPSYQSFQVPSSISTFAGTPFEALQPHLNDIVLFRNMHIHGGSVKTGSNYAEEHGAGLVGCVTGNVVKYAGGNDSYFAITDNESIDMRIAREYASRTALAGLPFSSIHLGAGANSDYDQGGEGQKYITFRARVAGDSNYSNAIKPIQNSGQAYDMIMQRIQLLCAQNSTQPGSDVEKMKAQLARRKSVVDLIMKDVSDAKTKYGLGTEHSLKLEGMLEGWREVEKVTTAELNQLNSQSTSTKTCPTLARTNSNGDGVKDLDKLSPIADQMIQIIQLAMEWDLTRVAALTLSGASSGQIWTSKKVTTYHHGLEHSTTNRGPELATMASYHTEKFAKLVSGLKAIDDGGGRSALYNSTVLMGMECASTGVSANRLAGVSGDHSLKHIPFYIAGQGAGRFQTGRVIDAQGRSNNDLLISCLQASGVQATTFGLASLCKGPII